MGIRINDSYFSYFHLVEGSSISFPIPERKEITLSLLSLVVFKFYFDSGHESNMLGDITISIYIIIHYDFNFDGELNVSLIL